MTPEATQQDNYHLDEPLPYEWRGVQWGDGTFVIHDVPEETVDAYVVSTVTRNVRSLAKADAVLYEGNIVKPFYEDRLVEFQHDMAGIVGRHLVTEFLDESAVRLKELPWVDLREVL